MFSSVAEILGRNVSDAHIKLLLVSCIHSNVDSSSFTNHQSIYVLTKLNQLTSDAAPAALGPLTSTSIRKRAQLTHLLALKSNYHKYLLLVFEIPRLKDQSFNDVAGLGDNIRIHHNNLCKKKKKLDGCEFLAYFHLCVKHST